VPAILIEVIDGLWIRMFVVEVPDNIRHNGRG
jgi:hypothetical protein